MMDSKSPGPGDWADVCSRGDATVEGNVDWRLVMDCSIASLRSVVLDLRLRLAAGLCRAIPLEPSPSLACSRSRLNFSFSLVKASPLRMLGSWQTVYLIM